MSQPTNQPHPLVKPFAPMPQIATMQWEGDLWRIGKDSTPVTKVYSAPHYRYDAPAQQYPALYTCDTETGTFAEVYGEKGYDIGPSQAQRHLLHLRTKSPLTLIDFRDPATLRALHLDVRICVGDDYPCCQAWALAIYQQYPNVCGIRYQSRKALISVSNIFLFGDRCLDALEIVEAPKLEDIEARVLLAADAYQITVFFAFK